MGEITRHREKAGCGSILIRQMLRDANTGYCLPPTQLFSSRSWLVVLRSSDVHPPSRQGGVQQRSSDHHPRSSDVHPQSQQGRVQQLI